MKLPFFTLLALLLIYLATFLIIPLLFFVSNAQGDVWPPIGSEAIYVCRFPMPTRPIIEGIRESMPDAYKNLLDLLEREGAFKDLPSSAREAVLDSVLLEWLGKKYTLACTIKLEIVGVEEGLIKVMASLSLEIRRYNPYNPLSLLTEEPIAKLGTSTKIIYIDPDTRSILLDNGKELGIWNLFLMPRELYEGSRVRVFSGYLYPREYADKLPYEVSLKRYEEESSGLVDTLAKRLGVPIERLLIGESRTVIAVKGTTGTPSNALGVIELEDLLEAAKRELGCGSKVKVSISIGGNTNLIYSTFIVVDFSTGLALYYSGPNDLIYRVFGLLNERSPYGCPLLFPEAVIFYLMEFSGFKPLRSSVEVSEGKNPTTLFSEYITILEALLIITIAILATMLAASYFLAYRRKR